MGGSIERITLSRDPRPHIHVVGLAALCDSGEKEEERGKAVLATSEPAIDPEGVLRWKWKCETVADFLTPRPAVAVAVAVAETLEGEEEPSADSSPLPKGAVAVAVAEAETLVGEKAPSAVSSFLLKYLKGAVGQPAHHQLESEGPEGRKEAGVLWWRWPRRMWHHGVPYLSHAKQRVAWEAVAVAVAVAVEALGGARASARFPTWPSLPQRTEGEQGWDRGRYPRYPRLGQGCMQEGPQEGRLPC